MPAYFLIKAVILCVLLLLAWLIIRPHRTQRSIAFRRLILLGIVIFAGFAVLFPGILNRLATALGVEKGINLLVYATILALFLHIASSYRRDAHTQEQMTLMARHIALANVRYPTSPTEESSQ